MLIIFTNDSLVKLLRFVLTEGNTFYGLRKYFVIFSVL